MTEGVVPHPVKVERMERLVEVVQRARARARAALRRAHARGARRGPVAHRPDAPARAHAPQQGRQLRRPRARPARSCRSRSTRPRARRSPARSRCSRARRAERARDRGRACRPPSRRVTAAASSSSTATACSSTPNGWVGGSRPASSPSSAGRYRGEVASGMGRSSAAQLAMSSAGSGPARGDRAGRIARAPTRRRADASSSGAGRGPRRGWRCSTPLRRRRRHDLRGLERHPRPDRSAPSASPGLLRTVRRAGSSRGRGAHGKPAPDLFLHAAGAMRRLARRCAVVEDSVYGVRAGIAARHAGAYSATAAAMRARRGAALRRSAPSRCGDRRDLPGLLAA